MNWIKQHPIIFSVIIFNLLLIAILVVVFFGYNSKTALLDVLVTPSDSKITLNGQEVKNFETQKFAPGQYTAKIEKDGMETKEISLNLEKDTTTKLHTYLTGANNDLYYYVSHQNDREILKNFSNDSQDIRNFFNQYNKITSILQQMPIYYSEYQGQEMVKDIKITQGSSDCQAYLCLQVVSTTPVEQSFIDNLIKEKGYNPQDYNFSYKIY